MSVKNILLSLIFFLASFPVNAQCYYELYMNDSYGDGWNGAYLEVKNNGLFIDNYECIDSLSVDSVFSFSGNSMEFIFHSGSWDSEISFTILDPTGDTLIDIISADNLDDLDFFIHISNSTCQNPISCPSPNTLVYNTISFNSANISWNPGGNETNWNIEWGLNGFSQGSGTISTSIIPNYSLAGLPINTNYDFYVQANCGVGDSSLWIGPISFKTFGDCSSSGSYDYRNNSTLDSSLNSFVANIPGDYITLNFTNGFTEIGYDYWFINDAADGLGNTIANGDSSIVGSFESVTGEISFYVVSDATVLGNQFVYSTSCSQPPSCPSPIFLSASNLTTLNADISWIPGGVETAWNIEYGVSGFVQGQGNSTIVNTASSSYSLTGLSPSTSYNYYAQAECGPNDQSTWSGPFLFTTNSLPPNPPTCGTFKIALYDSFGDGWQGGSIDVEVNYIVTQTITLQNGFGPEFFVFPVDSGDILNIIYSKGSFDNENSYEVYNQLGVIVASESDTTGNGPNDTNGLISCESNSNGGFGSCGWYILETYDSFADGWNGSYLKVIQDGGVIYNFTMDSGTGTKTIPFMVDSNSVIDILYYQNSASDQDQNSYTLKDNFGNIIANESGSVNTPPINTFGIIACETNNPNNVIESFNKVLIYPNPFKNHLIIEGEDIESIKVFDIRGTLIYNSTKSSTIKNIDWINGVYIMAIQNQKHSRSYKLIKY